MILRRLVPVLFLIFFSSCRSVEIAENLSQYQAHKIITELNTQGINSYSKSSQSNRGRYSIYVDRANRLAAISLVTARGMLPKPEDGFNELTKSSGFLPNSRDIEKLRLDRALAFELEEILLSNPYVAEAKAVVRVNYGKNKKDDSSVSVVINLKADAPQSSDEDFRKVVVNSIPGINPDKVVISLTEVPKQTGMAKWFGLGSENAVPVALVPFLIWNVPAGVDFELGIAILLFLLIVLGIGYFCGYFLSSKGSRKTHTTGLPDAGLSALRIDESAGKEGDVK